MVHEQGPPRGRCLRRRGHGRIRRRHGRSRGDRHRRRHRERDPVRPARGRRLRPDQGRAGAGQDNAVIPYKGVKGSDLTHRQQQPLLDLAEVYVGCIHSPVVLIEYDAQSPLAYHEGEDGTGGGPGPQGGTSQQHIHTIIRTPNGNDYGVDLLRLHLETDH
ncbi:DUF3500 domain-containing protein [Streptomyces sp. B93]|uniref:DUF3500 domain-containing protein n=1 Tax=Streptomyces sp. B93 TaxID=2824875 RepID=UPI001B392A60|nr:DUF3500 domain-containing protein [Streptomyces sp. B93]MBQ1089537.1 DUF3500 domain-containing protein [Streptomyces sp. B93]